MREKIVRPAVFHARSWPDFVLPLSSIYLTLLTAFCLIFPLPWGVSWEQRLRNYDMDEKVSQPHVKTFHTLWHSDVAPSSELVHNLNWYGENFFNHMWGCKVSCWIQYRPLELTFKSSELSLTQNILHEREASLRCYDMIWSLRLYVHTFMCAAEWKVSLDGTHHLYGR